MSKLKLQVTKEGMDEALEDQGDLVMPPKGMYIVSLEAVTPGYKKTEGGGEDKSRPNIKCQWKIVGVGREGEDPTENYMHIFDYVAFSEAAQWKVDEFATAIGLSLGRKKTGTLEIEIDPDKPGTVIGTQALMRVKHEHQDGYEPSPKCAKLLPLADADKVPDAFGDDDDTSEEPPDDEDVFGGDDADDDADDDGDLLTMEDLEGMEPKELAATAEEFDIDISSFTGKGRSAAAKKENKMKQVREAILEAQGAEDEDDGDDDDGDDEDPF